MSATSRDEWPTARLGDLIVAKYGKALPQRVRRGGVVPVFGSNGIVGFHDAEVSSGPTIIIGRKGSSGAINFSSVPCWPIDTTYYIDDPGPFLPSFLDMLLGTLGLEELDRSTAIPGLNREQLYDIEVAVPPKEIQTALVAMISDATRRGESASAHLATARRSIERFREAIVDSACSGRLTLAWRSAHPLRVVEPAPALSPQAGKNASGADNTSDLVELPEGWAWWTVESVTSTVIDYRGRTPPSETSGPVPHVRTTQIRSGRVNWNTDRFITHATYDEYMTRGVPRRGDVLFTMEAPMGDVGVVDRDEPFSIAQRILLMRPRDDIDSDFLCLALRSIRVQRAIEFRATGSGVLGIAYKRLRSVEIPKPPIEEQREIARRTRQMLAIVDSVERKIEVARARVGRTAGAVLAKGLRGDLLAASEMQ